MAISHDLMKISSASYEDGRWTKDPKKIKEMMKSNLELFIVVEYEGKKDFKLLTDLIGKSIIVGNETLNIKSANRNPVWGSDGPYMGHPNRATWNIIMWLDSTMEINKLSAKRKAKYTPKDAETFAKMYFPNGTPDFTDGPASYKVVHWDKVASALNENRR